MRITKTTTALVNGEYIVKAYTEVNGKTVRYRDADYFTTDKEDARITAQAMVNSTEVRDTTSQYDVRDMALEKAKKKYPKAYDLYVARVTGLPGNWKVRVVVQHTNELSSRTTLRYWFHNDAVWLQVD